MAPDVSRAGRRREILVLAGGLASTIALLGAAFTSYGDPERAGESELARLMGVFEDAVVAEWDRMRRDPWPFEDATGSFAWEIARDELEPETPAPVDWLADRSTPHPAFDALLGEARRIEREEGDPAEALEVVLETLTKSCDAPRRAEARLRAIQLAGRTERADVARAQWELAWGELEGWEARDDTSYLLLATLAATPHLTAERRREARDRLVELWSGGRLALPDPLSEGDESNVGGAHAGTLRHPLLLVRDSVRELVQALAEEPDPRLEEAELVHRGRLVAHELGELGRPMVPGSWGVRRLDEGLLAFRGIPAHPSRMEGVVLEPGGFEQRVLRAISEADLLAPGYLVRIGDLVTGVGAKALDSIDSDPHLDPEPYVREPARLPDSDLELTVSHFDPDSVISSEARRARLLRAGLIVLALFTGAAAFTTVRVLRRERALAALRTSFVANVSHELRTPLSSILLMAENLERRLVKSDETREKYHGLIRREAQRLRRLVDDVLDFSRLDRGERLRVEWTDVDVAAFARELEEQARELAPEAVLRVDDAPPTARLDEDAVRRAALNLVDNAVKHGGGGAVEVTLAGGPDGALRIRVRDRGVGIEPARRTAVFEPFTRLAATGNGTPGAGLGLAIVREIAEAHGGSAACLAPDDGEGAAFEIFLPSVGGNARMEEA